MMEILTEADLRAKRVSAGLAEYHVSAGTFVTPLAKEYLRDRKISLVIDDGSRAAAKTMTRTPIPTDGPRRFIDYETGAGMSEKPEDMTHLRGNLLVSKTHPRIAFRGRLDSLQAEILLLQASCASCEGLCRDLGDVLCFVQSVLGSEVKDEPFEAIRLFGLDEKEIREMSHQVKKYFGIDHPIPDYRMGETALRLNLLRTQVRETELAASAAFPEGDTLGLIKALNRLSSGVYILFCRVISGYYK